MHASLINMNIVTYYLLESMGDEPRKNNTRANKGSPLLSEEVNLHNFLDRMQSRGLE